MPESNKKQPKGAPELPDETKQLLDDQGDISAQKSTEPENLPTVIEPSVADNADEPSDEPDEPVENEPEADPGQHRLRRFFAGFWRHKKWSVPLLLLSILAILLAVPVTRYPILSPFFSNTYDVAIVDSKTNTPVSGATVTVADQSATTDSEGRVKVRTSVGKQMLHVSKQYYKTADLQIFVGLKPSRASNSVLLSATGRQVPLMIVDKLSHKPITDADIRVLDTNAKTDDQGKATIVLPTKNAAETAIVTANGFNKAKAKVQVTDKTIVANTIGMVPSGRVYFLSNLSGNVDVVSTNFDGTARTTIAGGVGNEDASTRLYTAPDQKHLALYAKRDDSKAAKLYVVDTATSQVTTMDTGIGDFEPISWSGNFFVYRFAKADVPEWKSGRTALKSYNADTSQVTTLASTTATGTDESTAKAEDIVDVLLFGGRVVYDKSWHQSFSYSGVPGRQNTLMSVRPDGSDSRTLKSVDASKSYFASLKLSKPDNVYFGSYSLTGQGAAYYRLSPNGSVTQSNTITDADLYKHYLVYYASPNGQHTFWAEVRDGRNAMFVGDANGGNEKQAALLDDFMPYGWNGDKYLLVTKNNSQLYILPAGGLPKGTQPMKVSDYFASTGGF